MAAPCRERYRPLPEGHDHRDGEEDDHRGVQPEVRVERHVSLGPCELARERRARQDLLRGSATEVRAADREDDAAHDEQQARHVQEVDLDHTGLRENERDRGDGVPGDQRGQGALGGGPVKEECKPFVDQLQEDDDPAGVLDFNDI